MLALTKKRPTKTRPATDTGNVDWREVFGSYEDHKLQGAALRGARAKEGLTQRQLSELANIPQGHLSEMENGKRPIGVIVAKKLGKALNISYKVFL
ncbi:MAG: helix-turn-helix transcriptional regulator [Desulfobacterales bacterium]|nr:helix-turn-helix transcriptional regulator [Desulfobacterales bacterium]